MNANFQAAVRADMLFTHGSGAEFSVPITYTPRDGGTPRTITGVFEVQGDELQPGTVHARGVRVVVRVPNHATLGILASEIDTGDTLTLKLNGADDETRKIATRGQNGQPLVTYDEFETVITLV